MLKIRDFAKLAEVSMTTLRYYDEIGLLKPIQVDPETGYRFYTMNQLPQLHRILAFKELGLGLTQIDAILKEGISSDALQGILQFRQAQLQQHLQEEQEQLVRIEARLRSLEHNSNLPAYEIVLKATKAITGVALRLTTADLVDQADWSNIIADMLQQYGVRPTDYLFVLSPEGDDEHTPRSVELIAPVAESNISALLTRSAGRLTRCALPAIPRMISTLHQGLPAQVTPAYHALGTWMEHNGYTIVGPRRKIFLHREGTLTDSLIEIQFPVEKVA